MCLDNGGIKNWIKSIDPSLKERVQKLECTRLEVSVELGRLYFGICER